MQEKDTPKAILGKWNIRDVAEVTVYDSTTGEELLRLDALEVKENIASKRKSFVIIEEIIALYLYNEKQPH